MGFNSIMLSVLFALEVQALVEQGRETEIGDLQQVYGLSETQAVSLVEVATKRYLSQVITLALRAAKRYDEGDAVRWVNTVAKYAVFMPETAKIAADANLYRAEDIDRLVTFFLTDLESKVDAARTRLNDLRSHPTSVQTVGENDDDTKSSSPDDDSAEVRAAEEELALLQAVDAQAVAERIKSLVFLTRDYVPPGRGTEGLMGKAADLKAHEEERKNPSDGKRKWSWS